MCFRVIFILFMASMLMGNSIYAQISGYEVTDNTGLNKREQINSIEKFLVDMTASLKAMESKIDANAAKVKSLEESLKVLKDQDLKKIQEQLLEKKSSSANEGDVKEQLAPITKEMEALKLDLITIKNEDIEKLHNDFRSLNSSVKSIQDLLKIIPK